MSGWVNWLTSAMNKHQCISSSDTGAASVRKWQMDRTDGAACSCFWDDRRCVRGVLQGQYHRRRMMSKPEYSADALQTATTYWTNDCT